MNDKDCGDSWAGAGGALGLLGSVWFAPETPPPISYSGQLCLQLKLPSSQGLPAELQVTLPRDSFISSNLLCQLPAISLCNKVSHTVISERVSGDVAHLKRPSEEGKLRTALSVLASTSPLCIASVPRRPSGASAFCYRTGHGDTYSVFGTPRFSPSDTRSWDHTTHQGTPWASDLRCVWPGPHWV